MKEHTAEVLGAVEGVNARLTQLEGRARKMENSIDDLKEALNSYHGRTDGKLRELQNLLREVEKCSLDLRDKQDIAVAQIQLINLAMSKKAETNLKKPETAARTESVQEAPPSVPQKSNQSFPIAAVPSQEETSTPASQVYSYLPQPNPLPTTQLSPVPLTSSQREAFRLIPPVAQGQPSPEQPHQFAAYHRPPPMPLPPMHQLQQQTCIAAAPTNPMPPGVQLQPTDFSHYQYQPQPRAAPESIHIPSSFVSPPFQRFDNPYLYPPGQPVNRPHLDFPPRPQLEPNFNNVYTHGRREYPLPYNNPAMESSNPLQSNISSGYSQLPTAQLLPEALPTVSIRDREEPDRDGSGNRVSTDDIVDKVVAMGFRRDVVRASVKRITDGGQPADLNVVLDILANQG
ncbi:hypothetical protein SAY86_005774 [Trapa natans]|uniref:DUF1421 domain-containing protein n=1 Tax=Trapa natans TaxID=22666 RepID=A0AAN7L1B4_TRANT|nr:hypothetical protein SAY86_005774 [Trapa natans]